MSRHLLSSSLIKMIGDLAHRDWSYVESRVQELDDARTILQLERNHVAGLLYVWFKEADRLSLLPDDRARPLKDFYIRQWLRTHYLLAEITDLCSRFDECQEPVILLKGPHVAKRFFGGIDRRAIEDIDMMVKPQALARACLIVEECGFQRTSWMPFGMGVSRRFTHYVDHAKGELALDLHHSIRVHPALRIDYELLWSSATPFAVKGRECYVLDDEHILLFQLLALHFDIARGYVRFRSFLDLLMMIRGVDSELDWDSFFAERSRDGTDRLSAEVISLCLGVFGCRSRYENLDRVVREISAPREMPLSDEECLRFLCDANRVTLLMWWARLFAWPTAMTLAWWVTGYPVRYASCQSNFLPRLFSGRLRERL